MKKGLRVKLFAFALALCLCTTMVTPAFAASGRYNSFGNRWSFSNWWNNRWNHDDDNTSDSNKSDRSETKLKLVEDQSTVAEGTELRASTYEVENTDAASNASTIKYFPVTMYNYDTKTINKATHNAEAAKAYANNQQSIDTWKGLYFNNGNPVNDRSHKYNRPEYLGDNAGTANGKEYRTQAYAKWNYWGGNVHYTGNYIYSGLVEKNLDNSNNIVFTNTDPGLFRSDDTTNSYGKEIYTNVGLPFQYDKSKNEYTFNSNEMSAHFTDKAKSNTNLTYDASPQTIKDLDAQGKNSKASWLPFDKETLIATDDATYHFGMQAVIPFSMTSNGRLNPADDESDAITFDFSGDDDVWVFVDGKLVLDIGGIHNEMAGTMNFATNEWKVLKSADNTCNDTVGDMNGQKMFGKLFNTDSEKGVLETDRETFAATTSHTLTVFYLERGAGASNCKIKFNLPMEDSVSVKKLVSDIDSNGDKISSDSQTNLDNHEFTFKLFKNDEPLANTNYIILDESNQPIDTATTAKDGTFKLKNKQTAKFVGQIPKDGNTYYVQEVEENGWQTPSSSYTALAANGSKEKQAADGATSAKVLIKGSDEANDQLNYTFTNVLTHVDTTTVQPQDDKIVIDYGLPVKIDVLDNDAPLTGSGNTIQKMEITGIRQAGSEDAFSAPTNNNNALQLTYGKAYIYAGEGTGESRDSRIIYTPTEQATDLDKIEYQVKVTAKTSGGNTETDTGEATVTVIPATSMYYEENFSDMAKFSASWKNVGTSGTVYQEPGVVGTPNDSPYGSDNAYMNSSGDSSGDSCGTSKYVDATANGATFSYKFTGTGTSFFARTTKNSGYMRVTVYDSGNKKVYTGYRDTSYKTNDENTTLYNIPVFTWNATEYGEYTVKVSIAKQTGNYGTDFWLDGIRVMNPMNPDSGSNLTIAQDAYAADGESNMTFATLRDALLADTRETENGELVWNNENFVVFTDSNGAITSASEYKSNGPKEEVYLAKDQSVSFSLTDWNANENHLYLGIKAPMGAGTVKLGNNSVAVNNTVDCYYDVAKHATISEVNGKKVATLTITNPSDSIISLTNIKVTGTPNFVIIPEKNADNVVPDEAED